MSAHETGQVAASAAEIYEQFEAASFDRVVSQFGLMFFQDRTQAISEILRVVRPGGKIGVAVWASLDATPGYAVVAEILEELFGPDGQSSIPTRRRKE